MSDYQISHLNAIHVTATASEALTSSNKIEALQTCSFTTNIEHVEMKHLNDETEGHSDHEALWTSISGTLAGNAKKGSATQAILKNAVRTRTPFYLHVIDTPDAATGEPKGIRYHLSIESGEAPLEAGALVTFSYSVLVKGKPVDIIAT